VDITGGKYSDIFTMAKHDHATIIVQVGVSAAAFTKIIVNACDDFTPSNRTAIPFRLYACETLNTAAGGDVLGAAQAVTSAGYTPSAVDGIVYVIEINSEELPAGKPNLELSLTNGANSVIASALAVLTTSRYAGDQSATVTA
jgi:hypothetical protein